LRPAAILEEVATDLRDVIRAGLDAWSRGDLQNTVAAFDPGIEFATSGIYPGLEPVYRGHDGFQRFWKDFRGTWDDIVIEVDQIVAGGQDLYAMAGRFVATGRNGIAVERPLGMLFRMQGDAIAEITSFGSGEEALRAAGAEASGYR